MKPNETFLFRKENVVHQDMVSLGRYYLPLIGQSGLSLYTYFLSFYDYGTSNHQFSEILNHLNLGVDVLEQSLSMLTAVQLVSFSQNDDQTYSIELKSPLDSESFLNHQVLSHLLEKKIGEVAFHRLKPETVLSAKSLNKRLVDVFGGVSDMGEKAPAPADNDFDLQHFKQLMARDHLRFEDEKADLLSLFHYAELANKSWFETYEAAKETAIGQVISTKRLLKTLEKDSLEIGEFSQGEHSLLRWAKTRKPLEFLADIKETRQASITNSERQVLKNLAQIGLLDSVINVLVLYTFNKINSANLNEKYALKLGNELSYKKINSAEAAVLFLREPRTQEQGKRTATKSTQSNVPEWSKESYRTEATPEELEELEALRRRMLGDKEA